MSYEAISKLGEGGFGSVWKMKTPKNQPFSEDHPIVALKRIKSPDDKDKEEVEILKKLDHQSSIIKYLTSFICKKSGDLCIVMEYCESGSLTTLVEKSKFKASNKNVAFMIFQIGLALEYVHEKGIIHRDIKPDNILCSLNR